MSVGPRPVSLMNKGFPRALQGKSKRKEEHLEQLKVQAVMALLKESMWWLKQAVKAKDGTNVMMMTSLQRARRSSLWIIHFVFEILLILAVSAHASHPCAYFFIDTAQKDFEGRVDPF